MASKSHRLGSFASSIEDLVPLLSIPPHQVRAAIDPRQPIAALAQRAQMANRITRRPLDIWRKRPSVARKLNETLAGGSEDLLN